MTKKMIKKTVLVVTAALVFTGVSGGAVSVSAAKKAKARISNSKLSLSVGQSKTLSVKNLTKKQAKKVKWSSDKKKVATVNKKGKVKAVKAGKATITAKVGKKKYTCKVTVTKKNTPVTKTPAELAAQDRANLTALISAQRALGARISEDLTNRNFYRWSDAGRLIYLNLSDDEIGDSGVSGTVDVTMFDALETLYLDYNKKVTAVKVSGMKSLKKLWCETTGLTAIDVSTNTNLEELVVSRTSVSSVDVSKNKKLTRLYCGESKVTKVDVTKNTELKSLSCDDLGLTSLDVSKNTKMTHLYCSGNNLTSLNVSNLVDLVQLNADGNKLTSIDLSNNKKLTLVYLHKNPLSSLDLSALGHGEKATVTCDEGVTVTEGSGSVSVEYRS